MNKVAIYLRLSVEDLDKKYEESDSIQNQRLLLTRYAASEGMKIYQVYVDDNYSGLDSNRPSFLRMIEDAKNKQFDIILCKTQSRFTRDMELVERYLHGLLPELGIRFIGLLDYVDTNVKANKKARQINGLLNEWYCEELSDNIRMVLDKKRKDGEFIGSIAPYGYRKSEFNRNKLIVDEEAAEIVSRIYSLYLEGLSISGIRDYLWREKIPTPREYMKYREMDHIKAEVGYSLWATSTIKKILKSKVYLGDMIQGKERKLSFKSKKIVQTKEEEWFIVEGTHEPIISLDIYEKVNEKLLCNQKNHKYTHYSKADPLISKVICGYCNKNMYKTSGNKSNTKYYHCSTYVKTKGKQCGKNSIRSDQLIHLIKEQIQELFTKFIHEYGIKKLERELHLKKLRLCDNKNVIPIEQLSLQERNLIKEQDLLQEQRLNNEQLVKEQMLSKEQILSVEIESCKQSVLDLYLDKNKGFISEDLYLDVLMKLNAKIIDLTKEINIVIDDIKKLNQNQKNKMIDEKKNITQDLINQKGQLNKTEKKIIDKEIINKQIIDKEQSLIDIFNQTLSKEENYEYLVRSMIETIHIKEQTKDNLDILIFWKI